MAKQLSPSERLERLVSESWEVVKKARRQRKSLAGDNCYAEKLAAQRSAATNLYNEMSVYNVGDVTALAEMIETVFSHHTDFDDRRMASRNLLHEIRTVWKIPSVGEPTNAADSIFPMTLLAKTRRGYLRTIGAQMNGAYAHGWCDACAVMMRRLLEASIIEAFEERGIAANIKNKNDEYVMLTEMINRAMAEKSWTLGRVTQNALPGLRDLGHQSAHGRRFTAQKSDIDRLRTDVRTTVEEFLHLAALL
jgi:hypothetical protein